ncbi:CHAT domain-containing protein [Mariprofundus sp. KV]|uniref:CHAT domain-containing protein n=1 Tax=Mariprofundus sp. KV TaxID=2608715 RepID=UPI0015A09A9E
MIFLMCLVFMFASTGLASEEEDVQMAVRYFQQGKLHYQKNEYHKAIEFFSKTLKINAGAGRVYAAYDHGWLGRSYLAINKLDKAAVHFAQELTVLKKHQMHSTSQYAATLNNLGRVSRKMADYKKAENFFKEALTLFASTDGKHSQGYANTQNNLAGLYEETAAYSKAEALYLDALKVNSQLTGKARVNTARSHNNIGLFYQKINKFGQARKHLIKALEIYKETVGDQDPLYAITLVNLAMVNERTQSFRLAMSQYRKAIIILKSQPNIHPAYTSALYNLARLYMTMRDYDRAFKTIVELIDIDKRMLGEQHPIFAGDLYVLGQIQAAAGDKEATQTFIRSSKIIKNSLGENHPSYARHINSLALRYLDEGKYKKAEPLFLQALTINRKAYGQRHSTVAFALNNLGLLNSSMNNYPKAEEYYRQAIAIQANDVNYNNLGYVLGVRKKSIEALDAFQTGQNHSDKLINALFDISSESQKLVLVMDQNWGYYGMLSLIHQQLKENDQAVRSGLDRVLARKGIVFDAQARQQKSIIDSFDPQARELWNTLNKNRTSLGALLKTSTKDGNSSKDYTERIEKLQDAIAVLEGKLAAKSALLSEGFRQRKIFSSDVASRLGKGQLLVEFVKIQDVDWSTGKFTTSRRYIAFILKADGLVTLVDLGEAEALEAKVHAALKPLGAIGSDSKLQEEASRSLYDLIWHPLAKTVGNAQSVIISPDGLLNLVPFNAMRDKAGKYLIESKQIAYVTTGRDLAKGNTGMKPQQALFLAANPSFDLAAASGSPASQNSAMTRSSGFSMRFSQLPGTEQEAREVPALLKGKSTIVLGKQATEASVLSAKPSKVIHLATHGFFLQDQPSLIADNTRGAMALMDDDDDQAAPKLPKGYENPLVRSGLAMAGANHANQSSGGDDGLLTALEVSGMNLHATDLVTLSACETGRGEVKSGEGVFGLRRAFALAGARNLVMSLWPVSDKVTATQMKQFYQGYGQGESPAQAMRTAQLATIKLLREKKGFAAPALWAPFMVQGRGN